MASGEVFKKVKVSGDVSSVAVSPDSKMLAVVGEEPSLWDIETGKELIKFERKGYLTGIKFTGDGKNVVFPMDDEGFTKDITGNDVTGKKQFTIKSGFKSLRAFDISQDGKFVVVADRYEPVAKIGDPATGNIIATFDLRNGESHKGDFKIEVEAAPGQAGGGGGGNCPNPKCQGGVTGQCYVCGGTGSTKVGFVSKTCTACRGGRLICSTCGGTGKKK